MLAKEIFGDEKYLVRFDMSEYSDKTAVNKLIGASAGYVGYNEGGLLTEAIKNKRHAVLLIDEIEKATEEIFNIFLQILDEGFLTDNTGYKVDFKNTILILTSNVGAKNAANEKPLGFITDDTSNKRDIIEKELKNKFPPEFLNRLDEIVYFNSLTDDNLKDIVKLELKKLSDRLEKTLPITFLRRLSLKKSMVLVLLQGQYRERLRTRLQTIFLKTSARARNSTFTQRTKCSITKLKYHNFHLRRVFIIK